MAKVKTGPKFVLAALLIVGGLYGVRWWNQNHGAAKMQSSVPQAGELVDFKEAPQAAGQQAGPAALASSTEKSDLPGQCIRTWIIPWNAQMGLALANGGPETMKGSLMEKNGVKLCIERQDDYGKMQEAMVACANELSKGAKVCKTGVNFVTIMGDGGPSFFDGLNRTLSRLGKQYIAKVAFSTGRSFGEDSFMTLPEVQSNPQKGRGLLVAGVLKDGDWNIAMFWANANGICNNPDVTTYDPDCLNWVGTNSFVEADDKYIQSYCEDRPVVSKGKKTGKKQNVCVNGVVTWTPGDVAVAKNKGGLVPVLSTRENSSQMPNAFIGIDVWMKSNADKVEGIISAVLEAGNQIKTGGQKVLMKAAEASAKIYKEETAAWWAKYYRGVEEEDKTGNLVRLGGSRVFNLADELRFFGLAEGTTNAFEATYVTFGNIAKQQYPKDLPSYPPVSEILDLTYIKAVAEKGATKQGVADAPKFDDSAAATEVIAKRSWNITFDTGKASFTKEASTTLKELFQQLVVASDTVVEIHGHTDNVGTEDGNQKLSEARAFAVRHWLEGQAKSSFPEGRLHVLAHGQKMPVAPNSTSDGRAKNRRVEIVLKRNS